MESNLQLCTRCNVPKELSLFLKKGSGNLCKPCRSEYNREWYLRNKEKKGAQNKEWAKNNRKVASENSRLWRNNNCERLRERSRELYYKNRELILEKRKQWREENPDKYLLRLKSSRKWKEENRERVLKCKREYGVRVDRRKYAASYQRKRRKEPAFRIAGNLRSRVISGIKRQQNGQDFSKATSTTGALCCTIPELIEYLESLFTAEMSWENYGKGIGKWNVDHIKPLTAFNLFDPQQFAEACHYTNLQPLWWDDNIAKGGA